jgi:hypothetical protein
MKQVTFKQIRELRGQFQNEQLEKKRNVRFFDKWISDLTQLLEGHNAYMDKKIEKSVFGKRFNNLYDQAYELNQLIDWVDLCKWRRDWTYADYNTHSLIVNNID